jgi:hypothetical protein
MRAVVSSWVMRVFDDGNSKVTNSKSVISCVAVIPQMKHADVSSIEDAGRRLR